MSNDDTQSRKKKTPRVWHVQHEKILKEWGESSSCYRHMHFRAYQINKTWSMGFTLPVIIISTVTGTANFAQKTFPSYIEAFVPSIIGAFNLFAAIMTTVAQFLKVTELMESHRVTSIHYGKLARKIRLELTLPTAERTQHGDNMVEICRAEYDRLIEQSPPVPKNVIITFNKKFPDSNIIFKPELTSFIRPIDLFDNAKEDERLKKIRKERETIRYVPSSQYNIVRELQSLNSRAIVSSGNRIPSHAVQHIEDDDPPESPPLTIIVE